jgi:hypothetical protein
VIQRLDYKQADQRARFDNVPFVSIDPGADGWALGWYPWQLVPCAFCHAYDPEALVALFRTVEACVAVVEGQYIGNLGMAGSVLEMSFRQGMSLGWLGAIMHHSDKTWTRKDLHLFQVSPSTWQARQRRRAGIPGRLPRAEGIALSIKRAAELVGDEAEWKGATKKQREGLASASGIGEWWRSLWEPEPIKVRR